MIRLPILFFFIAITISCSTSKDETSLTEDIYVEWRVEKVLPGSDHASFTIINTGTQPLADDWAIYFNQITGRDVEAFSPATASIKRISGEYFRLAPTNQFKNLLSGDTLVLDYKLAGPVARKSFTPQGMYYVIGTSEPKMVNDENIHYYESGLPSSLLGITPQERWTSNDKLTPLEKSELLPFLPSPVKWRYFKDTLIETKVSISYLQGMENEADHLGMRLSKFFNGTINLTPNDSSALIQLNFDKGLKRSESYKLTIGDGGIKISAFDNSGLFYAIQSLTGLIIHDGKKTDELRIRYNRIEDSPRFSYRGLHIDVARNFKSKEAILNILDIMSFYKLNKLNLQLSDDEGWRIEIPSLPELHEVGGKRGHTDDESDRLNPAYGSGPFTENSDRGGTGWYTREDYVEILKYANQRHIEVIPKIDFPGHARAAIKAMETRYYRLKEEGADEKFASAYLISDLNDKSDYRSIQGYTDNVICVCEESVYDFLEVVVDDIYAMYSDANAPFSIFHLGGDEVPNGVWEKSEPCKLLTRQNNWEDKKNSLSSYFIGRANEILAKRSLITSGWEEFASLEKDGGLVPNPDFVDKKILPYVWHKEYAYPLANQGYKLIISNSNSLYFDLAYEQDVYEPGLTWAGYVGMEQPFILDPFRLEVDEKLEKSENILGLQAQVWGETIWNDDRLFYFIIPKIYSFAERTWAAEPKWASRKGSSKERLYQKDWNTLVNTISQKELRNTLLLVGDINIRIPRPGAKIEEGLLFANSEMPGFEIRYTTDGSEPTISSDLYEIPVEVTGTVKLKSFYGYRNSFTTTITNAQ